MLIDSIIDRKKDETAIDMVDKYFAVSNAQRR